MRLLHLAQLLVFGVWIDKRQHYYSTVEAWVTVVTPRQHQFGSVSQTTMVKGRRRPAKSISIVQRRQSALFASSAASVSDLYTPADGSMVGQTVVITGATSGLGLESAKRLALAGASLILTGRSDAKGQAAVETVTQHVQEKSKRSYPDQSIRYKVLDLDDLASVRQSANQDWGDIDTIDVLLNNAGIMALPTCERTVDGWERQMQSNHLGHFLLTGLLSSRFSETARIVTVSSTAHALAGSRGLQWDYFWQPTESSYGPWKSYAQSKLANILFTQELQRQCRAAGRNWTAVTLHPGVVATDLARYMMGTTDSLSGTTDADAKRDPWWTRIVRQGLSLFLKTPAQGATTQIWLASQTTEEMGGQYFVDCRAQELPWFATDPYAAGRLWQESVDRTGVVYSFEKDSSNKVAQTTG